MGRRILFSIWLTVGGVVAVAQSQQELFVEQLQSSEAFKTAVLHGAVSSKANLLGVVSADKSLKILDLSTFSEKVSVANLPTQINALCFSASGQSLALGGADGLLYLLNSANGTTSKSLLVHSLSVNALVLQDESWIFSAGADKLVAITEAVSGSSLGSLDDLKDEGSAIAVEAGAKEFAIGLSTGQVQRYSIGKLTLINSMTNAQSRITALSYSPDGKYIAAGTTDGTAYVWNVQTGALVLNYLQKGTISSIAFDPKARWMVSTALDGSLKFYDLEKRAGVKTMSEPDGFATFAAFANDEVLLTGSNKGIVRRWKVLAEPPDTTNPGIVFEQPETSGTGLLKAFANEYEFRGIVYDNIGLKGVTLNGTSVNLTAISNDDASKIPQGVKAAKRFSATLKLDSIGVFPYEIVVADKYKHTITRTGEIQRISKDDAVDVISPVNNMETEMITVPIKFQTWFDVASYSISRNLVDIVTGQVPGFAVAGDTIVDEVPLVLGYNQINLSITGKHGDEYSKVIGVSRRSASLTGSQPIVSTGKRDRSSGPQKWAVVVGVSEYASPNIPGLKYADKDAQALADFLRRPEGGGYDNNHLRVLLNSDATLSNIKDALINFLGQAIDMDLVLIYFAGHGAPEPARAQNMYLLTYDSDPTQLGTTAFPMWDIQTVLARHINAKRVVVFSDACHSGNISVNFTTRGLGVTEQNLINQYLTDLSKTKEGVVVFTASAAGEVSQEYPEFNHGVFTYYMLEGLEGKADYNNDYTVTINELMQYVEEQVKRKTRGAQNPTRSQTEYDKDMTISLVPH
jgi:WD40 repeat protein